MFNLFEYSYCIILHDIVKFDSSPRIGFNWHQIVQVSSSSGYGLWCARRARFGFPLGARFGDSAVESALMLKALCDRLARVAEALVSLSKPMKSP